MMSNRKRRITLQMLAALALLLGGLWISQAASAGDTVLIYALYYDTYLTNEPDEAFALVNVSAGNVSLTGWQVSDGEGAVSFPAYTLSPGQVIWAARTATSFTAEFGFSPDFEYGGNSDPGVPDLPGSAPLFANGGDEISLLDDGSAVVDVLVYEGGNTGSSGWSGAALQPYDQGYFGLEGQVLYRKLDESTGLPVPDTDTRADWAQDPADDYDGKKVRYPGWDLEHFFFTQHVTEFARLSYLIAPDNIFDAYLAEISQASESVYIEGYSFTNAQLADALVARLQAGVTVKILLEEEIVAGISDQEKWICQQIESNGGECWFMYTDDAADAHDRYTYQHAKFTLVDESVLLTGSENLNGTSMPADDKADGTWGNRGVYLITDAPTLAAHALDIFACDLDPANHRDVRRWQASTDAPPAGFVPDYTTGGSGYWVRFPAPLHLTGTFQFEVVQAPENGLRTQDSLLGLVGRAGSGDVVLVQQLYERTYWGPTGSDPSADPNPRLEAYLDAARRGATVYILLDSYYDDPGDPRGNAATCAYANNIAAYEALHLLCRLGNPTGTGIHNKMVLVWASTQGWVHTGSMNGSENSVKANRELAVQVQSNAAYDYLAAMFMADWGGPGVYLPVIIRDPTPVPTPTPAPPISGDVQIIEVFYDGSGLGEADEYVAIENMDTQAIQLQDWTLSDRAGHKFTFPNYLIQPGKVCRIYTNQHRPAWCGFNYGSGSPIWNNDGDTAILRDSSGTRIDKYRYP